MDPNDQRFMMPETYDFSKKYNPLFVRKLTACQTKASIFVVYFNARDLLFQTLKLIYLFLALAGATRVAPASNVLQRVWHAALPRPLARGLHLRHQPTAPRGFRLRRGPLLYSHCFCRLLAVVCSVQSTVLAAWNGVLTTTTYGTCCRDVAAIRV